MSADRGISGVRTSFSRESLNYEDKFSYNDRSTKKNASAGDFSTYNSPNDRVQTADHVDVHVFLLPQKDWKNELNLAFNEAASSAVSLGFLRVNRNTCLVELSLLIKEKCSSVKTPLPSQFAFIKSVGRAYAVVKEEQKSELKVKHFMSLNSSSASEVFLIESSSQHEEVYEEELIEESVIFADDHHARIAEEQRNAAALKIQGYYRAYRERQSMKQIEPEVVMTDDQLQDKLENARNKRLEMEGMREEMIKYLKQLHNKITLARKEARVTWKRNYFAEKKKQPKDKETMKMNLIHIENWQEKLYQQLMIAKIGTTEDPQTRDNVIAYLKLKDSIFLYNRQLEQAKVKLATDIKLRNQAESERTSLRKELVNTRININQLKKITV